VNEEVLNEKKYLKKYKTLSDYSKKAEIGDVIYTSYDVGDPNYKPDDVLKRVSSKDYYTVVDKKRDDIVVTQGRSKKRYTFSPSSYDEVVWLIKRPEKTKTSNDNKNMGKLHDVTGIKTRFLGEPEYKDLLSPKEQKWAKGNDVKIFGGGDGFLFTDGELEMIVKDGKFVKKLGMADKDTKKVYQQNESVVNEAKGKPKFKVGQKVHYLPKMSGLSPEKKFKITSVTYKDGDRRTKAGYHYDLPFMKGAVLAAHEKDIKLAESVVNERKYSDQTGVKTALMREPQFSNLLSPKEQKWVRGNDVKIYKDRFGFIFTDGKREMVFSIKPFSVVKPMGNARSEIKKVYQQNESVVSEAKSDLDYVVDTIRDVYGNMPINKFTHHVANRTKYTIDQLEKVYRAYGDLRARDRDKTDLKRLFKSYGLKESVVNEKNVPKKGSPDYHQHKIAKDTVKNPRKSFMGGPSVEEAEETLMDKFGYTKKEIEKLKESVVNESLLTEATRSQVGIIDKSGNIISSYVHYDGYPQGVGKTLKQAYNGAKTKQLLKTAGKDGISVLDKDIKGGKGHSFENPVKGQTIFYGRDRGDKGNNMMAKGNINNLEKYLKDADSSYGAEYVYLYDMNDNKWVYNLSTMVL
jgi:hypothetical protein